MSGLDLDAIETRLNGQQPTMDAGPREWGEWAAIQQRIVEIDTPALVARVRDLESTARRVEEVAVDLGHRGDSIAEKRDTGSIAMNHMKGRGEGYREAARNIRAALKGDDA